MKTIDRIVILAVAVGLWAHAAALLFVAEPSQAQNRSEIVYVVEDCRVYGDVVIHDSWYGEVDGGYIRC